LKRTALSRPRIKSSENNFHESIPKSFAHTMTDDVPFTEQERVWHELELAEYRARRHWAKQGKYQVSLYNEFNLVREKSPSSTRRAGRG
jgi:hypothetical protein